MMNTDSSVNDVRLVGKRASGFRFSHRAWGTDYYMTDFAAERLSGMRDWILVRVSEKQCETLSQNLDEYVRIRGYFQSFNCSEQGRRRLLWSVFAKMLDIPSEAGASENSIYLEGYVCWETVFRYTWAGMQATDILLAVNRPYRGTDYLPCISWGKYALLAAGFPVGKRIWLRGCTQSRDYVKDIGGATVVRRAYKVSACEVGPVEAVAS